MVIGELDHAGPLDHNEKQLTSTQHFCAKHHPKNVTNFNSINSHNNVMSSVH